VAEVRFYHLTELPLERALPPMLERTLQRGQRAVVRGTDPGRLQLLDRHLWTYSDESFLPHGLDGDPGPGHQPVWLTGSAEVPNGARALFLVDGATALPEEMAGMEVTAILFDGHDPAAVEAARGQWRAVTAAGLAAVYWAQDGGRWIKRSEAAARG
jgi:DNA polymerase-3 subunit chi